MGSDKRKYESARQIQRQSDILASAREILSDSGYTGMTMRGLAEKAGVAPATLYNLYGGKDELILAAVDDLLNELGRRTTALEPAEGVDTILALAEVTARQIQATPEYAEAMARALFKVESDDPLVDVLFARGHPLLEAQLVIAQEKGQIRPEVDTDIVARHLTGQSWGVVMLWMMGMLSLEDMGRERVRASLMTLLSVARGATKRRLEERLNDIGWRGVSANRRVATAPRRRKSAK